MRGLSRSASDTVIAERPSCLPISLRVISRFTVYASTRDTLSHHPRGPVSCYPLAGPPRSAAACPRTACPTATDSSSATSRRPPPRATGSRSSSPSAVAPASDAAAEVAAALEAAVLPEYRGGGCAIAINDRTRPVPHDVLLPPLLRRLERAGVRPDDVLFIIATGTHAPTPPAQFGDTVPAGILERYRVVSHDAHDAQGLAGARRDLEGHPRLDQPRVPRARTPRRRRASSSRTSSSGSPEA